jgi:hypothetical protein
LKDIIPDKKKLKKASGHAYDLVMWTLQTNFPRARHYGTEVSYEEEKVSDTVNFAILRLVNFI